MEICSLAGAAVRGSTATTYAVMAAASMLLVASAGAGGLVPEAYAQFQTGGVDKEGTWHAGEGLKHGDYFSYSMCHVDYKECAKFRLDLWIEGDIQVGSETKWLAQVVVYDGNRITKGNMELGKIAPEPTGGTEELGVYRGAFKSSVVWLSAFATADSDQGGKGPKAFSDTSWGKIGNIGGEQVLPLAVEDVRAAGETWETVRIGWKTGGASSNVWIVDDFPFPIKAKTYTHVSEGIPPTEYEFILLDYKEGVTEDPFADVIPTTELMAAQGCETGFDKDTVFKKSTVGAMYQIHVAYGPEDPKQGCSMEWLIKFISKYDETEFLNQVQFDVLTFDEEQKLARSLAAEDGKQFLYSASGQYLIEIPIDEEPGTTNYVILVYGLSPENIRTSPDTVDYVEIPIVIYENPMLGIQDPGDVSAGGGDQPDPEQTTAEIPDWIKTNAGWWAEGLIDDNSFVQGIQYLIKQGIIEIPATEPGSGSSGTDAAAEIPGWIKTNAGWWAEGLIDDNSFVQGIQYLIQNGIMTIS